MKLKSIASLCKNRKMVYIYSGSGCQYIGQGVCLLDGAGNPGSEQGKCPHHL